MRTPRPEQRLWTPEEDLRLRKLHGTGLGWSKMALMFNRTIGSLESRARKLRVLKPRAPHRDKSGGYIPAGVPLELGEGDHRYIEACLEQGGFASSTRVGGKIVFGHGGKAWVQP